MSTPLSLRVPDDVAESLRSRAAEEDRTVSDVANRAIDEYLRAARFPGIVFVTSAGGRRTAKLATGPDVWEVVFVARDYALDSAAAAAHLNLTQAAVRLALAYYAAYPAEIDARLKRMEEFDSNPECCAPGVRVFAVGNLSHAPAD